jgi:hypothetical protein
MTQHKVGTREEWLAARRELLEREKEHMRQGDELARRRQELPWVPIEKTYVFESSSGKKTLAELFDGRSQFSSTTSCSATGSESTSRTRDAPAARSSPITSTARCRTSTAAT